MCLGINYCNSILLTSSGSTFGFWIAYLLPDNSTVFYNNKISKNNDYVKDKWDYDWFLKEWIPIKVENGVARKIIKLWRDNEKMLGL